MKRIITVGRKVIIVPDSFKGSMSSALVAEILGRSARKAGFETMEVSLADGGEGTIDSILKITGGRKRSVKVVGPDRSTIEAVYGITSDNEAVIEIAESTGITKQKELHPMTAGTYGFGQLIGDALDNGIRSFLLGLGGSASTDCGMGMAAALGTRFFDEEGQYIIPCGENMRKLREVDISNMDPRIRKSRFRVLCDVTNPLIGYEGAAYVYAPQKGADEEQVRILDDGLKNAAGLIARATGCDPKNVFGAGAAGGCGYGCAAFLNAKIESGIEVILGLCDFDTRVRECDMIVTGEGKLDLQSLMGKVLSGLKRHSGNKPVVSFCGICELEEDVLQRENITAIEIGRGIPLEEAVRNGAVYLQRAAEDFFEKVTASGSSALFSL